VEENDAPAFEENPAIHLGDVFLVTKHAAYKSASHANSDGCQINTQPSLPAFDNCFQRPFRPAT